jgi:hypothetical protein
LLTKILLSLPFPGPERDGKGFAKWKCKQEINREKWWMEGGDGKRKLKRS